jgi:hypothetical protein
MKHLFYRCKYNPGIQLNPITEALRRLTGKTHNIPSSRIVLQLKNVGNASAEEIKYSMAVPGYIVRYAYTPSKSESPVWVDMPEDRDFGFASTAQSLTQVVKNLATNKVLQFTVGYEPKEKNGNPQIEVYYSGKQAKNVAAISEAPEWNPYRVFILPASILGIGLVITVLWVIVTTLLRRPRIREELAEVLGAFARNLSEIMRPF